MTKDELRIAVAEARGYTRADNFEDTLGELPVWKSPEGYLISEAWIPDYLHSMDVCITLVEEMGKAPDLIGVTMHYYADFENGRGIYYCTMDFRKGGWNVSGNGITMSEAICRAYIKWKEEDNYE